MDIIARLAGELGVKTFTQCASFLRIPGGANLLDNTGVHPETYEATYRMLEILGCSLADFQHRRVALADLTGLVKRCKLACPL